MLFEWCVQAFPCGHVGPLATAGNKRWLGKGLCKRRRWPGRGSSQEVAAYLLHVICSVSYHSTLPASFRPEADPPEADLALDEMRTSIPTVKFDPFGP